MEGLGQLKNPVTSSGIEPVTFWLVAYCLNQLHYCVPSICIGAVINDNHVFSFGMPVLLLRASAMSVV
jgi:hypothetical protein